MKQKERFVQHFDDDEHNEKYNSLVIIEEINKNGRVFNNLVVTTTLTSGEVVRYQVKLAFYNNKFAYKLSQNLPRK